MNKKSITYVLLIIAFLSAMVMNSYAFPKTINPSSLVGWWPMEEGSGVSTRDASGINANTGTLNNTPVWIVGKFGKGIRFNGTNQSITKASPTGIPTTNAARTYVGWVWIDSTFTTDATIIATGVNVSNQGSGIGVTSTSKASFFIAGAGLGQSGTTTVSNNCWHHIAGTSNGTVIKVYLDGKIDKIGSGTLNTSSSAITMGCWVDSAQAFLKGYLDDVRIYNRTLSDTEIAQMYKSGISTH